MDIEKKAKKREAAKKWKINNPEKLKAIRAAYYKKRQAEYSKENGFVAELDQAKYASAFRRFHYGMWRLIDIQEEYGIYPPAFKKQYEIWKAEEEKKKEEKSNKIREVQARILAMTLDD